MSSRFITVKKLTFWFLIPMWLAAALACADGLAPVPFQGISGTVTYLSEPDSVTTDWVRLAVYEELPETELDLLNILAFTDTLALVGPAAPYVLALAEGEYAWLVVVWKEKGNEALPGSLRAAGWYTAGGGPFDTPVSFLVQPDSETAAINVIADFENMLTVQEVLELLQ